MEMLRKIWNDDNGQDMVEYALIAGLISVVAFAAVQSTGGSIKTVWSTVSTNMTSAAGA